MYHHAYAVHQDLYLPAGKTHPNPWSLINEGWQAGSSV